MAISTNALEVYRLQAAAYDKYVGLLTAVAGACIAFAVQKSEGAVLNSQLLVWGAAVTTWALSFSCGCANMRAVQATLRSNFDLLLLQHGEHPLQPSGERQLEHAMEVVGEQLQRKTDATGFFYKWQFRLLALGAALFIAWHLMRLPTDPHNSMPSKGASITAPRS